MVRIELLSVKVGCTMAETKKKVLIAEDEELNYLFLYELLSYLDVEIIRARNGLEAVELYKEMLPDIVLMDIKMPVLDGYSAANEIRKLNSTVPIIVQTAYALIGERERALKAGCNDYISKPINSDELLKIMNEHIN